MTQELALQKAIRTQLISSPELTALVPAINILDRNERPNPVPSIILGEDQSIESGGIARSLTRIFHILHVWSKEESLEGVKEIVGAIRKAMSARPQLEDGYHCVDCRVSQTRFLRDPDGETSHGVVTIEALVQEVGS